MRLTATSCLLFVLCLLAFPSTAQQPDGLTQDAKGRYVFVHTSMAPALTKEAMYERMKPFIVEVLNASDNFIRWDESGHDSVKTIAFFELGNSSGGDIINQVVDCKARLDFREGEVRLRLSGFNYSGLVEGKAYGTPMHRLAALPYYAQSYATLAFEQALRDLSEKMDAAAAGVGSKSRAKRGKKAAR